MYNNISINLHNMRLILFIFKNFRLPIAGSLNKVLKLYPHDLNLKKNLQLF